MLKAQILAFDRKIMAWHRSHDVIASTDFDPQQTNT
jgi:hypothetical protein